MKEAPLITMNSPIKVLILHLNYVHFNDRNTRIFLWFQGASMLANVRVIKMIKAFDVPHIIQCAAIERKCRKSCNEFQGFVLLCSLPLKHLSLSEIPFSSSEAVLTLIGEKLAAAFCRIKDFVSFTCQLLG